jgi:hypothetical protein
LVALIAAGSALYLATAARGELSDHSVAKLDELESTYRHATSEPARYEAIAHERGRRVMLPVMITLAVFAAAGILLLTPPQRRAPVAVTKAQPRPVGRSEPFDSGVASRLTVPSAPLAVPLPAARSEAAGLLTRKLR